MTIANNFISDLDAHRDDLYSRALAAASADPHAAGLSPSALHIRAEVLLQSAIRETFAQFEKVPDINPFQEIARHLPKIENQISEGEKIENHPMPADIWARLVTAIQVEADRSTHANAINPDSVPLNPDPLLAPRKPAVPDDLEGLGLLPEYRFLLAGVIAILVAIILTIYILTRTPTPSPHTSPAPETPETQPASLPDEVTR